MMLSPRRVFKAAQRGCYRLLNTHAGALCILILAALLLNMSLHFTDSAIGSNILYQGLYPVDMFDTSDNIAERSFETILCEEPIDAVYTWVNGSEEVHQREVEFWQRQQKNEDPVFIAMMAAAAGGGGGATEAHGVNHTSTTSTSTTTTTTTAAPASLSPPLPPPLLSQQQLDDQSSRSRFEDHDELLYSIRSLEKYAGWVRYVYIVTNGQVPTWLNLNHPRIRIVTHRDIFPNASHLPTFSSPAIESHLHRIPGLSRRFLYLNDDTMFAAPVAPSDFYSKMKGHRLYYSWPVPQCSDGCPAAWLGDGTCDRQCNTSSCDYDAGDCLGPNVKVIGGSAAASGGGGGAAPPTPRGQPPKQSNKHCHGNCADGWLGDRYCDTSCNHRDCGYDHLDCGTTPYETDWAFPKFNVTLREQQRVFVESTAAQVAVEQRVLRVDAAFRLVFTDDEGEEPSSPSTPTEGVVDASLPLPRGRAFLVNLSHVLPLNSATAKITSGDHDSPSWVRAATIVQQHKLLVVSVVSEWEKYPRTCQFVIEGEREVDTVPKTQEEIDVMNKIAAAASRRAEQQRRGMSQTAFTTTAAPVAVSAVKTRIRILLNISIVSARRVAEQQHGHHIKNTITKSIAFAAINEVQPPPSSSAAPVPEDGGASTTTAQGTREPLLIPASADAAAAAARRLLQLSRERTEAQQAWDRVLAMDPASNVEVEEELAEEDTVTLTQRRLMDLFGDSLKHTNMLMTRKFKSTSRKVPAHMVHFIDRNVMEELWSTWPAEWAATSASKFRSRSNLQYAFMHYYWMVHATQQMSWEDLFRFSVDVDGSGVMELREARRVALMLWEKEVPQGPLDEVSKGIVQGCLHVIQEEQQQQQQQSDEHLQRNGTEETVLNSEPSNETEPGSHQLQQQEEQSNSLINSSTPPSSTTTAAPPPVWTPTPHPKAQEILAESRNVEVCKQVLLIPGTDHVLHLLKPPTRAPLRGRYAATTQSPPSAATRNSDEENQHHHHRSNVTSALKSNHSRVNGSWWMRRHGAHQTTASPAASPAATPHSTPAPMLYRVPVVNPDDKIRPMTTGYYQTVLWLLRAAATGIGRLGNDTVVDHKWPTNTEGDTTAHSSSSSTSSSSAQNPLDMIDPVPLTAATFGESHVAQILADKYGLVKKYKTTVEDLDDVTFIMVRNNRTIVQHQMDHVLFKRPKFLCVNDDMNHSSSEFPAILNIVQTSFRAYYPEPSSFELPNNGRNAFTRLSERYRLTPLNSSREPPRYIVEDGHSGNDVVLPLNGSSSQDTLASLLLAGVDWTVVVVQPVAPSTMRALTTLQKVTFAVLTGAFCLLLLRVLIAAMHAQRRGLHPQD